ncbi:hypothetical protein [Bacillus paramycoides]|uniref:hypothetical protein n=1 Tax=Bacillus paramycoides TaxID=2026194 RepID=UPI002E1FF53A|nr:hypothetical protein [Bacillus paramycoides]
MSSDIVVAIISGSVTIIVGGISALAAYKGAIKGAKLQIEKAQNDADDAIKEEERSARRFIESFLYQEIESNLEIVPSVIVYAFNRKAKNTLTNDIEVGTYNFSRDMYNEIRPQLNKINDLEFISDIIGIYQCFDKINQIKKIGLSTNEDSSKIHEMLEKWISKLNVKHLE